jgi:hypothetical protein
MEKCFDCECENDFLVKGEGKGMVECILTAASKGNFVGFPPLKLKVRLLFGGVVVTKSLTPLKYKSYILSLRDDIIFFLCFFYKHSVPNGTAPLGAKCL